MIVTAIYFCETYSDSQPQPPLGSRYDTFAFVRSLVRSALCKAKTLLMFDTDAYYALFLQGSFDNNQCQVSCYRHVLSILTLMYIFDIDMPEYFKIQLKSTIENWVLVF